MVSFLHLWLRVLFYYPLLHCQKLGRGKFGKLIYTKNIYWSYDMTISYTVALGFSKSISYNFNFVTSTISEGRTFQNTTLSKGSFGVHSSSCFSGNFIGFSRNTGFVVKCIAFTFYICFKPQHLSKKYINTLFLSL